MIGRWRPITPRQRDVLAFIVKTIRERGFPPTLRELGAALGIRSTNGVVDHLRALVRKGYIARDPLASRAIKVLSAEPYERPLPRKIPTAKRRPYHCALCRKPGHQARTCPRMKDPKSPLAERNGERA